MQKGEEVSDERGVTRGEHHDNSKTKKGRTLALSFFFSSATQKVERSTAQINERKSFMVSLLLLLDQ